MKTRYLLAAVALLGLSVSAVAQQQKTVLGLEAAKKMAAACEETARKEGWNMIIAIVDDGGNLKHFSRMDNSFRASIEIAQQRVPGIVHVPGIVTFAGGLPIVTAKGEHIGAIGVSGASADQDEVCAQAGLDAVKSELNLK